MQNKNQIFILSGLVTVALLAVGVTTYSLGGSQSGQSGQVAKLTVQAFDEAAPVVTEPVSQPVVADTVVTEPVSQLAVVDEAVTETCPANGVKNTNGDCVLSQTYMLTVDEPTLDCNGATLVPSATNTPEVGLMIYKMSGATIKNCTLKNFKFAIAVVGTKGAKINQVKENIIENAVTGVLLVKADHTQIKGNKITFGTATTGGRAVSGFGNSDYNVVKDNEMIQNGTSSVAAQLLPGWTSTIPAPTPTVPQPYWEGRTASVTAGIFFCACGGRPNANIPINGSPVAMTYVAPGSTDSYNAVLSDYLDSSGAPEENEFKDNKITLGSSPTTGSVMGIWIKDDQTRTMVKDNEIYKGRVGIVVAGDGSSTPQTAPQGAVNTPSVDVMVKDNYIYASGETAIKTTFDSGRYSKCTTVKDNFYEDAPYTLPTPAYCPSTTF